MESWESFAVAQVGAAAVLAGLIFVGVSVNLDRILELDGLSGRAGEALIVLLGLLVAATLLLVPGLSLTHYAEALIVIGASAGISAFFLSTHVEQQWRRDRMRWALLRLFLSMLATVPFIIAGAVTLVQGESGLVWLVVATIGTFLSSFLSAWVLLVEIKR